MKQLKNYKRHTAKCVRIQRLSGGVHEGFLQELGFGLSLERGAGFGQRRMRGRSFQQGQLVGG